MENREEKEANNLNLHIEEQLHHQAEAIEQIQILLRAAEQESIDRALEEMRNKMQVQVDEEHEASDRICAQVVEAFGHDPHMQSRVKWFVDNMPVHKALVTQVMEIFLSRERQRLEQEADLVRHSMLLPALRQK